MLSTDKMEYLGSIGVDAGCVMIGDPCYHLHREKDSPAPKSFGKTWPDFIVSMEHNGPLGQVLLFDHDDPGCLAAVVVNTAHGDGTYGVYAVHKGGRYKGVYVEFEED